MGVGLRVGFPLPLPFPVVIWKLIAGQAVTLADVEGTDASFGRRIRELMAAAKEAQAAVLASLQAQSYSASASHDIDWNDGQRFQSR